MKKKILITTIALLAITMVFAIANTAKASSTTVKGPDSVIEVNDSTGINYYTDLNEGLAAAKTGATITLLKDYNVSQITQKDSGYARALIDGERTLTFDFGEYTISSDETLGSDIATFAVKNGATVTFKGTTGGITNGHGGGALLIVSSKVNLDGGKYAQTGNPTKDTDNYGVVTASESTTLNVNNGTTITSSDGTGVTAYGSKPTITINEGVTIDANSFAVAGNGGKTTESTITINGGTLTSKETAAIYHPESGKLTINGGKITGQYGIVSRQGTVEVKGGTITAIGTEETTVGDAKAAKLPIGAIVTDNSTAGYGNPTEVEVTNGTIEGNIVGYNDEETDDIVLSGGSYNTEIPTEYLEETTLEVQKGSMYYLGNSAEKALTNAKKDEELTVLNGSVDLSNVHSGVIVTNKGRGEVTLNGHKIEGTVDVVNETEKELEDLQKKLADLEKQLEDNKKLSEDEINELKDKVNNLEKENNELKDRIEKLEKDNKELNNKVDELEKENSELKDKIDKLEDKVDQLKPSTNTGDQKEDEEEEKDTTSSKGELDDEPKTGNTYAIPAGILSLVSIVGAVVSKKFVK